MILNTRGCDGCNAAAQTRTLRGYMGDVTYDPASFDPGTFDPGIYDPGMSTDTGTSASSGASDSSASSILNSVLNSIGPVATAYNTQQIMNANLQRAQKGLPPLDQSAYAPQVSVGLSSDTKSMLMIAAIGLGLLLFMRRRG
jgi:hypothetical protein